MDTLHERLRYIRKRAGHRSARSAAMRFGWSPSTYAAHENGQNAFDTETALRYATAFKGDPSWLLFAKEGTPENNTAGFVLRLSGYISETEKVSYIDKRKIEDQRTIICFTQLPESCFLFKVNDDSLDPRYREDDILIMAPVDFEKDEGNIVGGEIIALFEDGQALFATVAQELEPGKFDLASFYREPMKGVALRGALILRAVLRYHGYIPRQESEAGYRP